MKILLVDDDPLARRVLRIGMEAKGWSIAEAGNGEEGLTIAGQFFPDAIISDGMMPDMDGFNFLREIRRKVLPEVVFIFYSAIYTGQIEEELARLLGADAFIQKPVPPQMLIERVKEIYRKSDQRVRDLTLVDDEATFLRKYNKVLQAAVEKKMMKPEEPKPDSQALLDKLKSELTEVSIRDIGKPEVTTESADLDYLPKELRDRDYVLSHLYRPLEQTKQTCLQLEQEHADSLTENGKAYVTQIIAAANRAEKLIDMMLVSPLVRQVEFEDVFKRIKIFTNMLQTEFAKGEAIHVPVTGIKNAIASTAAMVKDIFELFSVIRTPLTREDVDLTAIALSIAERLKMSAPHRKIDFSIQNGLHAYGDRSLLRILLVNLLSNAWKFTATKEEAEIAFGLEQDARTFYVTDNGTGFSMADIEKLFIPFSRLTTGEEPSGTGLGLVTARKVVERHGGTIQAVGNPGNGAVFRFSIAA